MSKSDRVKAAEIVRDSGGEVVGRTRLQKIGFLLELAGFGDGFEFEYRHYGPYSEELASGIRLAGAFGLIDEEERPTEWGGFYSIYRARPTMGHATDRDRAAFAREAAGISAVVLELAATAAYLHAEEGVADPWAETARRKPEKARDGRLDEAKEAYRRLLELKTRKPLPPIV